MVYRLALSIVALFTALLCLVFSILLSFVNENTFESVAEFILKITHFFFGPALFLLTVWGLAHPSDSLYLCGEENTDPKVISFSFSSLFALMLCFTVSGVLTYFYLKQRLKYWIRSILTDETSFAGRLYRRLTDRRI